MSDLVNLPEDKEQLISLPDAAEIYGFNRRYLSAIARKGRLEAKKIGGSWITTPAAVEAYISSREKTGAYREDIQLPN